MANLFVETNDLLERIRLFKTSGLAGLTVTDLIFLFISDWTKRIEYQPGSGSVPLFPSIHLETCDGAVSSLQVTAELQTNYIGKGCDRETYSEKSLQKLCGRLSFGEFVQLIAFQ